MGGWSSRARWSSRTSISTSSRRRWTRSTSGSRSISRPWRASRSAARRRTERSTMGIFSRLAQLIKSNLNDLISRSEDPEKMLNQVVLEMSTQLIEAKKQVAASIADEKRLAKQLEQELATAQEWERKAMLALRAGNKAAPDEALARKREHDELAATYKDQWTKQDTAVEPLKKAH